MTGVELLNAAGFDLSDQELEDFTKEVNQRAASMAVEKALTKDGGFDPPKRGGNTALYAAIKAYVADHKPSLIESASEIVAREWIDAALWHAGVGKPGREMWIERAATHRDTLTHTRDA